MEVIVTKGFLKDLRLCPKYIQEKAGSIIATLEKTETLNKSGLDYSKMEGQKKNENYYRIRVGDWRIGIELKMPGIIMITILSRGEVYRKFPPK